MDSRREPLIAREQALLEALLPGPAPASALATALKMNRSLLGLTAKRLRDLGYLSDQREEAQGRARRVYRLTEFGRAEIQRKRFS